MRRPASGEVGVVRRARVQSELVHVTDNSDDRIPARLGIERAEIEPVADWILAREESVGECFVDHDFVLQRPVVARQIASLYQRNADGGEILRSDDAGLSDGADGAVWQRLAFDQE